ncbi:MAG: hypothetical protein VB048_05950 [Bacteroidaceae bacterium]|jgi:hypothetical protein|nr:hypothetical protein [Bacteroidaceae bacterium]MEA5100039.1 hypothetical protein [Bacteroidales bacterium]
MKDEKSLVRSSSAEYLTYIASTGDGGVNAIYADENIWLTQKMMGVLYNVETHTINYHLKKIFSDSELEENSVVRNFRITAADGKLYNTKHYNLSAIIAATDREILINAGRVTAEIAKAHAESEFQKYRIIQDQLFESDFDREINRLNENND